MRLRPTGSDTDGRLATEPHGGGPAQPPPLDLEQRRFDLKMIGLMLVLVAVLVGGLSVYLHFHDRAVARARARADAAARAAAAQAEAAQKVAEVKQAYLDYSAALTRMDMQLSLSPIHPYVTEAGFQQELGAFQRIPTSGPHYLLEFSNHDIRVVAYANGVLASVDDVFLQHLTPLDPTTLVPAGQEQTLPVHASFAMKLQDGRWLVDSVVTFGTDGSDPSLGFSYVAKNMDTPLNNDVSNQIQRDYETYWAARTQAYRDLDPAPLRAAILPGALDKDLSVLNMQIQRKQGFAIRVEHNEHVALKDPDTAYVYDTIADSSFFFDFATGQRLLPPPVTILRETHELKKVGGQWKVDMVATDTSK